jgi:hypothetical protein
MIVVSETAQRIEIAEILFKENIINTPEEYFEVLNNGPTEKQLKKIAKKLKRFYR